MFSRGIIFHKFFINFPNIFCQETQCVTSSVCNKRVTIRVWGVINLYNVYLFICEKTISKFSLSIFTIAYYRFYIIKPLSNRRGTARKISILGRRAIPEWETPKNLLTISATSKGV